ncbi:hypothetical protein BTI679_47690 [Bacillus wiedmannii]|nr:hypothetical protein BTI679_47690 [Bacillus wiedmannii]
MKKFPIEKSIGGFFVRYAQIYEKMLLVRAWHK